MPNKTPQQIAEEAYAACDACAHDPICLECAEQMIADVRREAAEDMRERAAEIGDEHATRYYGDAIRALPVEPESKA